MNDYAKLLRNMPVMPEVATKIMSIAEDKIDISFRELENMIKLDPGLSAKVLKVANSAMYARQKEVQSLQMAITLLGFKNIKSLVLLVTASNMFSRDKESGFYSFFWKHSILNAFMARDLAKLSGSRSIADESFLAGLLHDIGQVALHNADAERYDHVFELAKSKHARISEVEQELFGTNHREVGAQVLREWNFPDVYVDSALEHGSANITSNNKQLILIVSIADFITSNIDLYSDSPLDVHLMDDIVRQSNVTPEQIAFMSTEFQESVKQDPLFTECQTLFRLG
jgi:putative nucleotidyltransferase with HDIG domain